MDRPLAFVAPFASFVLLSGTLACSGGPGAPAPAAEATPRVEAKTAEPAHRPGAWFFRHVAALDLRDDQRASITAIHDQLALDMLPHREALRGAFRGLADAVEQGQLDDASAQAQKGALLAALASAKASIADAVNGVHDTLDPAQRVALVEQLRAEHETHARADGRPKHGLAKLALAIGLSEEQEARIRDALSQGLDEVFPDRKARREAREAKMKALAEAFVTDDFDAADFDLADHADEVIATSVAMASRGVDVTSRVLSAGQRRLAAEWMRGRAEEL
jgi:Spy/CpxP family protein refolding chaperone